MPATHLSKRRSLAENQGANVIVGLVTLTLIIYAFPFLLVCAPFFWWRERRLWNRLARVGRVIEWAEAHGRAKTDVGTFIVRRAFPHGFAALWFVEVPVTTIASAAEVPRWSESPLGNSRMMTRAARRRLDALAPSALRVRVGRRELRQVTAELEKLPAVEYDGFSHIALGGKPAQEVFAQPFENAELESLRLQRERLLELQDEHVGRAEYEAAKCVRRQAITVERTLCRKLAR